MLGQQNPTKQNRESTNRMKLKKKSVKATKLGQIMRQKSHNGPKDQRSENQHLTSEGEHLYLFNSVL